MRLHKAMMGLAAGVALSGALMCGSAMASDQGFAALPGVEAQPLTPSEMEAVAGQLNAYDIAAQLNALADKYATTAPKLSAATRQLANQTLANAESINALFQKLGVLTPCLTCK